MNKQMNEWINKSITNKRTNKQKINKSNQQTNPHLDCLIVEVEAECNAGVEGVLWLCSAVDIHHLLGLTGGSTMALFNGEIRTKIGSYSSYYENWSSYFLIWAATEEKTGMESSELYKVAESIAPK
jgi:hypothetical protein